MITKDPTVKVPITLETVFSTPWLDEKADGDPSGRTNRELQAVVCLGYNCSFSAHTS